ncbi:Predicted arabinose efflux permease, MFS family [Variovorax sp. OK605]|jgi:MFS family permease|uniref:MFS transporter n=1 Tax=Variovorax sp. OK605 TaxID=1855317 RepID=UPI0008E97555|nr:MFS transporter [Variovorax sp. OK605]SFQ73664.1 Predicted arabinose efflux permease, MFS family [Variovorax sp. OK605]
MTNAAPSPSRRSLRALDALAFFAPDIQGGVGPFLIVFMAGTLAWDPQRIGTVMFVSALVGLAVQAPAGALIDSVRHKPRWIAGAVALIAACLVVMANWPGYGVILAGQSLIGAAGTLVAPAIAATSLGMVGRAGLDARVGRNAAITAAGTVLWALGTGWVGHAFGPQAMFFYAVAMALPTMAAAMLIRSRDVDARLARGADAEAQAGAAPSAGRWYDRRLVVLLVCAFLFHLANAAMLTLVAQKVGTRAGTSATLWLSAGVIVTQLVTIPIGLAVGRWAPRLARKPIFLAGFGVLPVRGLLYLLADSPAALLSLQVLDGIGAGIFGVMLTLTIGDLTRGSGHFNFALGIGAACVGLGAALSNLLAGTVAHLAGYGMAFVLLAAIAAGALTLFALAMPETRGRRDSMANAPAAPVLSTAAP